MKIYGHSDDCIEVEGTHICEEFYIHKGGSYLRFDNDLVVRCTFNEQKDVGWRFSVINLPATNTVEEIGPDEDGDYSLIIYGKEPEAVVCDDTPSGPSSGMARDLLEDFDRWRNLTDEQVIRVVLFLRDEIGVL